MKVSVILLAAGMGVRMGGARPKAFLTLGGRHLYQHSLGVFRSMKEVGQVVLVVPKGRRDGVEGGPRRQDSVANGLREVNPASDVILVHDAARPFITPEVVRKVIQGALEHGGAVPGVPVRDTLKRVGDLGRVEATLDRTGLWAVQTPQGFRKGVLEAAYAAGHALEDATDEAQIVERAGGTVVVVEGLPENFKITSKIDLLLAENYLSRRRRSRTTRGTPSLPHPAVAPEERRRTHPAGAPQERRRTPRRRP